MKVSIMVAMFIRLELEDMRLLLPFAPGWLTGGVENALPAGLGLFVTGVWHRGDGVEGVVAFAFTLACCC